MPTEGEAKIAEWVVWLNRIGDELRDLLWAREIYLAVHDIVTRNSRINVPNRFYTWIDRIFAHTAVMAM